MYFASQYPRAQVVTVEPSQSNFELLCRNVDGFSNVRPMRGALAPQEGWFQIANPGATSWAFRTAPCLGSRGGIRGVTIESILREEGASRIGILKLDIEGSELDLLRSCGAWIDSVDVLVIELHDRIVPGCTAAFDSATESFPVRWQRGELHGAARV